MFQGINNGEVLEMMIKHSLLLLHTEAESTLPGKCSVNLGFETFPNFLESYRNSWIIHDY